MIITKTVQNTLAAKVRVRVAFLGVKAYLINIHVNGIKMNDTAIILVSSSGLNINTGRIISFNIVSSR